MSESGSEGEGAREEVIVKEDEIIRKIIREMVRNSILHDISDPKYQKDRNAAIEATALKLKITPKLLRKKITYIKCQYTRQRDALNNARKIKGRSGDGLPEDSGIKKKPKVWKWYDDCHFLDDVDVDDMVETHIFSHYGPVQVNSAEDVRHEAADMLTNLGGRSSCTIPEHYGNRTPPSSHDPSIHVDADIDPDTVFSQNPFELQPPPLLACPSNRYQSDQKHFEPVPGTSRDYRGSCPPPLLPRPSNRDQRNQKYFEPVPGTSRDHRGSRPPPLLPSPSNRDQRNLKYFEPVPGTSKDYLESRPLYPHPNTTTNQDRKQFEPSLSSILRTSPVYDQRHFEPVPGTSRDHRGSRPPEKCDQSKQNKLYFEPVSTLLDNNLEPMKRISGILDTSPTVDTDIMFMILNVVHSFLKDYSRMDQLRVLTELTAFLKDFDNKIKNNKE